MQQLGYVNNLGIALAALALGFGLQDAGEKGKFEGVEGPLVFSAVLLSAISLAIGTYVAWNRLRSIRIETRIARERGRWRMSEINILRYERDALDSRTWFLLPLQLMTLAAAAIVFLVFGGFALLSG